MKEGHCVQYTEVRQESSCLFFDGLCFSPLFTHGNLGS